MQISSSDASLPALSALPRTDAAQRRKAALADEQAVKEKAAAPARPVDTVELTETKPAAPVAQLSRSAAQESSTPPPSPDTLVASVLKAFGSRSGDDGFNASLDINGDGVINFADLNAALAGQNAPPQTGGPSPIEQPANAPTPQALDADNAGEIAPAQGEQPGAPSAPAQADDADEPRVYTNKDIELVLGAFGAGADDERFDPELDFDGDGQIGFPDLNELLARLDQGQSPQQTLIDQLTDLFGLSANDQRFNPALDFDNDGVINFTDLNTLLARLAESRAAQP